LNESVRPSIRSLPVVRRAAVTIEREPGYGSEVSGQGSRKWSRRDQIMLVKENEPCKERIRMFLKRS
jgi:hypothetical protein